MNRSNLPLGLCKLKKYWDSPERTLRCDLPFQRHAGVWSPITKSNLVWSMLADSYIPPIVLLKDRTEDGKGFIYEIEDGQQRLTNLFSFMDGEWVLHGSTPEVEIDGQLYELAGKSFEELPKEIQNTISQYRFTIQCLENYTLKEAEALFFNINSGVPLSAVQKAKPKLGTDLIRFFTGLLEGSFFSQAVNITAAQAKREDDLLMLLQSVALLDNRHEGYYYKSISASEMLNYAAEAGSSYNQGKQRMLSEIIYYLDEAFQERNKFLRKNNVPIVVVVAKVALECGLSSDDYRQFIEHFADTVYPEYEEASSSGNVKARNVQMRLRVMFLALLKFFELSLDKVIPPFSPVVELLEGIKTDSPLLWNIDIEKYGVPAGDEAGVGKELPDEGISHEEVKGVLTAEDCQSTENTPEESTDGEVPVDAADIPA